MRRDTVLGVSAASIYIVPEAAVRAWRDGDGTDGALRRARGTAAVAVRYTFWRAARVVSVSPSTNTCHVPRYGARGEHCFDLHGAGGRLAWGVRGRRLRAHV